MRNRVTDTTRPKSYTKWSPQEHMQMVKMLEEGSTHRVIGLAIGRSENAVSSRLTQRYRPRTIGFLPVIEYPTARVPKQLVIDWYEIGWRVLGIGATDCVMEWRLSRPPEYPHACKVEATIPDRVLEVA